MVLSIHFAALARRAWRRGREVEGTPLLREHAGKTCIEGSNPSVSATLFPVAANAVNPIPNTHEPAPMIN